MHDQLTRAHTRQLLIGVRKAAEGAGAHDVEVVGRVPRLEHNLCAASGVGGGAEEEGSGGGALSPIL